MAARVLLLVGERAKGQRGQVRSIDTQHRHPSACLTTWIQSSTKWPSSDAMCMRCKLATPVRVLGHLAAREPAALQGVLVTSQFLCALARSSLCYLGSGPKLKARTVKHEAPGRRAKSEALSKTVPWRCLYAPRACLIALLSEAQRHGDLTRDERVGCDGAAATAPACAHACAVHRLGTEVSRGRFALQSIGAPTEARRCWWRAAPCAAHDNDDDGNSSKNQDDQQHNQHSVTHRWWKPIAFGSQNGSGLRLGYKNQVWR